MTNFRLIYVRRLRHFNKPVTHCWSRFIILLFITISKHLQSPSFIAYHFSHVIIPFLYILASSYLLTCHSLFQILSSLILVTISIKAFSYANFCEKSFHELFSLLCLRRSSHSHWPVTNYSSCFIFPKFYGNIKVFPLQTIATYLLHTTFYFLCMRRSSHLCKRVIHGSLHFVFPFSNDIKILPFASVPYITICYTFFCCILRLFRHFVKYVTQIWSYFSFIGFIMISKHSLLKLLILSYL